MANLNLADTGMEQQEILDSIQNQQSGTYPTGFTWPLSGGVWDNFVATKYGEKVTCSIKPSDLVDLTTYTNKVYVDGSKSTSGDGSSWANSVRSIDDGVNLAITSAVATQVFIKGGTYDRSLSLGWTGSKNLAAPIALVAVYGGVFTGVFDYHSWTPSGAHSQVYQTARSAAVNCVDPSSKDENGDYHQYITATSLADCASKQGSWWTDNITTYIHAIGGGVVTNANARVYLGTSGATLSGDHDSYCYGINFEHGKDGALRLVNGANNTAILDHCSLKYACMGDSLVNRYQMDGLQVLGCKLVAAFNSQASKNSKDGFNLHESGGVVPVLLTVNCSGFNNGQMILNSTSNNGITMHDGCKAIDIGGTWLGSIGTNAAHINNGTQVWHFGSVAGNSEGDVINGGSIDWGAFGAWSGTTEMWLENCIDVGSSIGVYANGGAKAYIKNHGGTGSYSGDVTDF